MPKLLLLPEDYLHVWELCMSSEQTYTCYEMCCTAFSFCHLSTKYNPRAQHQACYANLCFGGQLSYGSANITYIYLHVPCAIEDLACRQWCGCNSGKHISSVAWVWWAADKIISLSSHIPLLLGNLLCLCPVDLSRSCGS